MTMYSTSENSVMFVNLGTVEQPCVVNIGKIVAVIPNPNLSDSSIIIFDDDIKVTIPQNAKILWAQIKNL